MLVSILIAVRNEEPQLLEATLAGLQATTRHIATDVIVVDDGSRAPILPASLAGARLLRHPKPLGACEARRSAALLARGEVLVWLDAHMSFGEHWLEQLLVQAAPDALVCSPFWSYDLKDCHCWGADFVWNPERNYAAGKHPGFALRHRVERPSGAAAEVPMVIGACYGMHRKAYDKLGGFSPHFRIWGLEEQDMCARAWMCGLRVLCATHARVGHYTRAIFPYPVLYEHLEFNQIVLARSLFESATLQHLNRYFEPIPPVVESWLALTNLSSWRKAIQRRRSMSDADFFARFVPELAKHAPATQLAGKAQSA